MENSNKPAFTISREMCEMPNNIEGYPTGLTKREYFSGLAMQSFIISGATKRISFIDKIKLYFGLEYKVTINIEHSFSDSAIASCEIADELLKQLEL